MLLCAGKIENDMGAGDSFMVHMVKGYGHELGVMRVVPHHDLDQQEGGGDQ
jgi:hypothetical protein